MNLSEYSNSTFPISSNIPNLGLAAALPSGLIGTSLFLLWGFFLHVWRKHVKKVHDRYPFSDELRVQLALADAYDFESRQGMRYLVLTNALLEMMQTSYHLNLATTDLLLRKSFVEKLSAAFEANLSLTVSPSEVSGYTYDAGDGYRLLPQIRRNEAENIINHLAQSILNDNALPIRQQNYLTLSSSSNNGPNNTRMPNEVIYHPGTPLESYISTKKDLYKFYLPRLLICASEFFFAVMMFSLSLNIYCNEENRMLTPKAILMFSISSIISVIALILGSLIMSAFCKKQYWHDLSQFTETQVSTNLFALVNSHFEIRQLNQNGIEPNPLNNARLINETQIQSLPATIAGESELNIISGPSL